MNILEKEIGKVIHFYNKICVAILKLTDTLSVGDTIHVVGKQTDLTQTADSLQIEHANISQGKARQEIGLKTLQPVREGDAVYKISA